MEEEEEEGREQSPDGAEPSNTAAACANQAHGPPSRTSSAFSSSAFLSSERGLFLRSVFVCVVVVYRRLPTVDALIASEDQLRGLIHTAKLLEDEAGGSETTHHGTAAARPRAGRRSSYGMPARSVASDGTSRITNML